ncbi:MAG TPA: NAD-dependent deacylase [Thermodesulforhabdus norvegica]|uniref:NAD-dependent protein deacylase n=1 Tax=Thermodesulforhabdus norvegica TaxID=39841 RepID=A0A7C1AY92_9BACT|nr:NAD-dependent deacylase [Thermodesulforhabdus norvegica]
MALNNSRTLRDKILKARELILSSEYVVVLTGAGISAESGVPTFRGSDGIWRNYNAMELATPEAFNTNPKLVWEFYLWRRRLIASCNPNPAHYALVKLEQKVPFFTLITQNVDGLHHKAGSKNVLEIHGNLWRVRCTRCGRNEYDTRTEMDIPPRCDSCDGILRPDVVWFGETLSTDVLAEAINSLKKADILLIVGTSGVVEPAASFGMIARQDGAFVIEVNLEKTPRSGFYNLTITGKAGEVLPQIVG